METNNIIKWVGMTIIFGALTFLVVWQFTSCSKAPLTPGEDKHFTDPAGVHLDAGK